jgi:hypothetical protein
MQIAMIMKNVLMDNANLVAQMMIIVKRVSSALMALVFNLVNQAKIAQRVTIAILIIKSAMRNVTVILIALEDTHVSMENVCCVVVCPNIAIQISIVTATTWFANQIVKTILSVERKKFVSMENVNLVA